MTLAIAQSDEYAGDGQWRWSVWIDGPDEELDQVDAVEYVLHPTFPDPTVRVNDRASKFRLDASGWGEFKIHAHVWTSDGGEQHLKHFLKLSEPGGESTAEAGRTLFLSAGIADADWEEAVRAALRERGVEVLSSKDVPAGAPVQQAISSTIDKADAVLGIFSGKSSPWVERELGTAMDKDVPVVPLAVGPDPRLPERLQGLRAVKVSELDDVDAVIGQVVDRLE